MNVILRHELRPLDPLAHCQHLLQVRSPSLRSIPERISRVGSSRQTRTVHCSVSLSVE